MYANVFSLSENINLSAKTLRKKIKVVKRLLATRPCSNISNARNVLFKANILLIKTDSKLTHRMMISYVALQWHSTNILQFQIRQHVREVMSLKLCRYFLRKIKLFTRSSFIS